MAEIVVGAVADRIRWCSRLLPEGTSESERLENVALKVLRRLKRLLKDADSRARLGDDKKVCGWVSEVVDSAYNLEDYLCVFGIKVRAGDGDVSELEEIRAEIEGLLSRLSAFTAELKGYGIRVSVETGDRRKLIKRRKAESGADFKDDDDDDDDDDVGLVEDDIDLERLVRAVVSNRHVYICGMGGSGKTALARHIFHHPAIRKHFDQFAWFHVPQYHDHQVRREIHEQLLRTRKSYASTTKCLIVLDDLQWNFLDYSDSPNIVLLATSRITLKVPYRNCLVHQVKCLDENKSWELFQKKANFSRDTTPDQEDYDEMKEVGQHILQGCAGLPLAIALLGKLLRTRRTSSEWKTLHNNIKAYLRQGVIHQKEDILQYSYILQVLGLSYNALPDYLKHCFLQLAQFPNSSAINVKEIYHMWAAEHVRFSPTFELNQLVDKNLVQVEKFDSHGRIKTVRLHNLMREFCLLQTREENYMQVINCGNTAEETESSDSESLLGVPTFKVHRVVINSSKDVTRDLLPLIEGMDVHRNLRSLICFNASPCPSYEQVMKEILLRFRRLRVLKFQNFGTHGYVGKLPEEIGELIHLTYLSLKDSYVEELPSSIGNLICLETLDLRTNGILELPNVMWKLEQLVHLYLPLRCNVRGNKLRFSSSMLTRLRTLVNIPLKYCDLNDFKIILIKVYKFKINFHAQLWKDFNLGLSETYCNRLRSLALENLDRSGINVLPFISRCTQLEKLNVQGKVASLVIENKLIITVERLSELSLSRSNLKQDPMSSLEKMVNLRILNLGHGAFKGNKMVCSTGGFPCLESLSLVGLEELEEWIVEEEALSNLKCLVIEYCYRLKEIPDGLKMITTLKKLVIKRMPRGFLMNVDKGGNDYFKVQHVPDIHRLD